MKDENGKKMLNVFDLWIKNNKDLPFFVRRWSWSDHSKFLVTEIKDVKWDYYKENGKLYGKAFGHYFNDDKKKGFSQLDNAGSYQWEVVEE